MKIKIGSYPSRLTSNIYINHMKKKYGFEWPDNKAIHETRFERLLEKLEDSIQSVYNVFNRVWFDRRTQKVKVHIDPWDTWSMDHTLAHIIVPMLIQLKETKHGAPYVDPKDVPIGLPPSKKTKKQKQNNETDDTHFNRWDWVLNEMIWSFEQKCLDNGWEEAYYKYEADETAQFGLKCIWRDDEGRNAHQERMSNGFRLFGKYFESLWD